jgi:hypothetical protein
MSWAPSCVLGVDVMAKRSQGLLNVGTPSRGLLAVSGAICGSIARGGAGAFFFSALWAAPGLFGCNEGRPSRPRGRCSGQPRSK